MALRGGKREGMPQLIVSSQPGRSTLRKTTKAVATSDALQSIQLTLAPALILILTSFVSGSLSPDLQGQLSFQYNKGYQERPSVNLRLTPPSMKSSLYVASFFDGASELPGLATEWLAFET